MQLDGICREPEIMASPPSAAARNLRCLWLARYLPYPLDAGAKVYSARLAQSLAATGVQVRFAGFGDAHAAARADSTIEWRAVPGQRRNPVVALWSQLPVAAAVDASGEYRRLLAAELEQAWDVIVFDGYGTGWALEICERRYARSPTRPVFVHVSHNHESAVWTTMTQEGGSVVKRLALGSNTRRIRSLEHRLLETADLVTTITEEDREAFAAMRKGKPMVALSPGFSGQPASHRTIDATTPRHVLLLGSFNWVVKRENLLRFIAIAAPEFARAGVTLDVVGDIPRSLLDNVKGTLATRFHGFVEDVSPFLAGARIACVPELVGGGFKLKFLDYFFGRLPVATLATAAAGLPADLRRETLCAADLETLVATIVRAIDRPSFLNALQLRAFELARDAFQWSDRGTRLHASILAVREQRGQAGAPVRSLS